MVFLKAIVEFVLIYLKIALCSNGMTKSSMQIRVFVLVALPLRVQSQRRRLIITVIVLERE